MNTVQIIEADENTPLEPSSGFPYLKFPFAEFNPIQSAALPHLDRDVNLVIDAPTASGKTVIAEACIAESLARKKVALYASPFKELTYEKLDEWTYDGGVFAGRRVCAITGDVTADPDLDQRIQTAELILLTSEMIDAHGRRKRSARTEYLDRAGAIVCDEIHLLDQERRGDRLESGLMAVTASNPDARLICLSATIQNSLEISRWLSTLNEKETVLVKSRWRPTELIIKFWPYSPPSRQYFVRRDARIKTAVQVIERECKDETTLAFVHTKADGRRLMNSLRKELDIRTTFHNAELSRSERREIVKQFLRRDLDTLVATSTLCLPAGTMIARTDGSLTPIEFLSPGDDVQSVDVRTGKLVHANVTETSCREVSEMTTVQLQSGETISGSLNHPVLVNDEGYLKWKPLGEITHKNWVSVPRRMRNKPSLHILSDSDAYALGLMHGDGSFGRYWNSSKTRTALAASYVCDSKDKALIEAVQTTFQAHSGTGKYPGIRPNAYGSLYIATKQSDATQWLGQFLEPVTHDRLRIFASILRNSNKRAFLQGLFDADGGVETNKVALCSISRGLLEDVKHALLEYGIRSSISGPKKPGREIRVTALNGKEYKSRSRHGVYALNLCGKNLVRFHDYVGFRLERKRRALALQARRIRKTTETGYSSDRIPIAGLLRSEFAVRGRGAAFRFNKKTRTDAWAICHKGQVPTRSTVLKSGIPAVVELGKSDLAWSKVKRISKTSARTLVYDITVPDTSCFIANGIVVHNSYGVNTPAKHVVIVGLERGPTIVSPMEVLQEAGRAGRPQYDSEGIVHIVCEYEQVDEWKRYFTEMPEVTSKLAGQSCLRFHVVSLVDTGRAKTPITVAQWHRRSLAALQSDPLDEDDARRLLRRIVEMGALAPVEDGYTTTHIGKVSARLYFDPLAVAQWSANWKTILDKDLLYNDVAVAWAAGRSEHLARLHGTYKAKGNIDRVRSFCLDLGLGPAQYGDVIAAFYWAMQNKSIDGLGHILPALWQDMWRMVAAWKWLAEVQKIPEAKLGYFERVGNRIRHGLNWEQSEFCRMSGMGPVRARKLTNSGIVTWKDFLVPQAQGGKRELTQGVLGSKKVYWKIAGQAASYLDEGRLTLLPQRVVRAPDIRPVSDPVPEPKKKGRGPGGIGVRKIRK